MRNANLDLLKQLIRGLSADERDELLSELVGLETPPSPKVLPKIAEKTVIETTVDTMAGLDYREFGLSEAHYLFCMEYVQNGFNGTEAYKTVISPGANHNSARAASVKLRHDPRIVRFLEVLFEQMVISNRQIEVQLQEMLSVSMEDLVDEEGTGIDLKQAKERGVLRGVQRLRKTEHGWDVQLYDRVKALDIITRSRGMQKQVKITADLDKLAEEFQVPARQLHEMKLRLKEQYKAQLLGNGGDD